MRKYVNAEALKHSMKLNQLGGNVTQINGKMCYVQFVVNNYELEYVYNINPKGQYFLERIKPYPLPLKEFNNEDDVVNIIEIDLEQFTNATQSHNIDAFVSISSKLNETLKRFEDLYLYYNVPEVETKIILEKIEEIQSEILKTKETCERVYFRKDPEFLR
jgi:hypothetical protein